MQSFLRGGTFASTLDLMNRWTFASLAALSVAGVLAVDACSSDPPATPVVDAGNDAVVPFADTCVKSPEPAPFPTGACNSPKPATPDSFDEALAKRGLDRCSLQLDPKKIAQYAVMDPTDPRQLQGLPPALDQPAAPSGLRRRDGQVARRRRRQQRPVSRAIAAASVRRGTPLGTCAPPEWFVVQLGDPTPLVTALGAVATDFGADFDATATAAAVAGVPLELQRALAPVVRALGGVYKAVDEAKQPSVAFAPRFKTAPDWVIGTIAYKWTDAQLAAFDGVDVAKMSQAAVQLANAVEAADLARFAGADLAAVDLDTPFGPFVLRGKGADTYLPGDAAERSAFLLDTGGNDVYRVPVAAATQDRPVSVSVDLGGDDTYAYVEKAATGDDLGHRLPSDGAGRAGRTLSRTGRQGSALLGIGLLYDLGAGKDTYRSLAVSQGVGIFGVGVLFDDGGDDTYAAESLVQGSAAWGIGLLLDRAGNDSYLAYAEAQGFGFTQGVGALVDDAGDDTYYTDPGHPDVGGDVIYANAQLPGKANTSIAQGCGFGHRPDSPEPGYQFAGGIGILRDASGKDKYATGVFGQASSFGMGIGLLLEGGGDDVYEGLWYVQGANAHTSVALFHDHAGNDQYNPTFPIASTSIGVGHDYSSAVHYDEGGNDTYRGPNLALGCGNANGIGVMVVAGGTDVFDVASLNTLGSANSTEVFGTPRRSIPTIGVFVKAGGASSYSVGGADAGDRVGSEWSYAPNNTDGGPDGGTAYDYEKSIGIDRPNGSATLP